MDVARINTGKLSTFDKEKNINSVTKNEKELLFIERTEYATIGDTTYIVTATEKANAEQTALDIIRKLIERKSENLIREERTCYLQTNGGTKKC